MNRNQNSFKILSNKKVCGTFYRMCIDAKDVAKKVQPGQFVNIKVTAGLEPFFRRPFSVSRSKNNLEILYDVVGVGTQALSSRIAGETLDILGPLGNAFSLPNKTIKQIVLISGGIGIAPLISLSDKLKSFKGSKVALLGGRTKQHICDAKILKDNGFKVFIATDDGSRGVKGLVSVLFPKIDNKVRDTFIYTCGPELMMAAVQDFASRFELNGEASCEEVMACGVGTCLGCVCKTKNGYQTVCHDGPVFNLKDVTLA